MDNVLSSLRIDDHNYIKYNRYDDGFHAILVNPNGASTMRMVYDYRTELGHRVVEKVVGFDIEDFERKKAETWSVIIPFPDL